MGHPAYRAQVALIAVMRGQSRDGTSRTDRSCGRASVKRQVRLRAFAELHLCTYRGPCHSPGGGLRDARKVQGSPGPRSSPTKLLGKAGPWVCVASRSSASHEPPYGGTRCAEVAARPAQGCHKGYVDRHASLSHLCMMRRRRCDALAALGLNHVGRAGLLSLRRKRQHVRLA
jgi:hypothetical protein